MGMARARSCEGVPRIARGDLEDGTHGQPDPRKLRHRRSNGGFAQNIKKTLRLDGTYLLDNKLFAFNGALMSERENIHSGGQIRQR